MLPSSAPTWPPLSSCIHTAPCGAALRGSRGRQRLTVQKVARGRVGSNRKSLWSSISSEPSPGPALHLTPTASLAALPGLVLFCFLQRRRTPHPSPRHDRCGCSVWTLAAGRSLLARCPILPGKCRAHSLAPQWISFSFCFSDEFSVLGAFSLYFSDCASRAHRAIIASCLGSRCFPFFWAALAVGRSAASHQDVGESSSCLRPILIVQRRDGPCDGGLSVVEPIE